jgi:hypothetical protein
MISAEATYIIEISRTIFLEVYRIIQLLGFIYHLNLKKKETLANKGAGTMCNYQHVQSFRRIIDVDATLESWVGLLSEMRGENTSRRP